MNEIDFRKRFEQLVREHDRMAAALKPFAEIASAISHKDFRTANSPESWGKWPVRKPDDKVEASFGDCQKAMWVLGELSK